MKARRFIVAAMLLPAVSVSLAACATEGSGGEGWQSKRDVTSRVAKLREQTDLPPGGVWSAEVSGSDKDRYQVGSADAIVLDEAQCEWYAYWLDREEASDTRGAASARRHFADLHRMPAFKANDDSYRQVVQAVEDAAELGDPSGIQQFVRDNCGDMQKGSDYR
ncbi:hypothetical protein [Streptomyces sp. NPDC026673]|uniref:hypothetical protein n=1 Tax=Streptomyces sp. NPDC026673 TaxID=3155724 RepID=UPI0033CA6B3E